MPAMARCGRAGWQVKLEKNVGDVALYGVLAQPQRLRDGGVTEPVGDARQHLAFARAQRFEAWCARDAAMRLQMLLGHDGEQPQISIDALDHFAAALDEMQARTRHQILDDAGDQHFAGRGLRRNPLRDVEGEAAGQVVANLDLAGMNSGCDPQLQRLGGVPQRHRTANGAHRAVEPGTDFSADPDRMAAMACDDVGRYAAEPIDARGP